MGMDSYKSPFLDGCPDGSGTKTKTYKPVSQIVRPISNFLLLNVHIPAYLVSRGKPFFWNSLVFYVVSADRRLVHIRTYKFVIQTHTSEIV
jgi:hypothetical protein